MKYLFDIGYVIISLVIIIDVIYSLIYVIKKKKQKEKISFNNILNLIFYFISLIFILIFLIVLNIDWLNYYVYINSAPFYTFIIVRSLEFLLPAVILLIICLFLKRKKVTKW